MFYKFKVKKGVQLLHLRGFCCCISGVSFGPQAVKAGAFLDVCSQGKWVFLKDTGQNFPDPLGSSVLC